jgi:hypothetical protein
MVKLFEEQEFPQVLKSKRFGWFCAFTSPGMAKKLHTKSKAKLARWVIIFFISLTLIIEESDDYPQMLISQKFILQ